MNLYGYEFQRESDLSHHGILGMHWGIRRFQPYSVRGRESGKGGREIGEAKRLSTSQIDNVHKVMERSKWNEDVSDKVFSITSADKRAIEQAKEALQKNLDTQRDITKQQEELFKKLESNEGFSNYSRAVAEIASYNGYKNIDDLTLNDIADAAFMGIFEDGGQSNINEYSLFAYKNGIQDKCDALNRKSIDAYSEGQKLAEAAIQTALDAVGGQSLSAFSKSPNYLASQAIVNHLINSDYDKWDDTKGYFLLDMASYAKSFSDKDKDAIRKAEKIASKIQNNRDTNNMTKNTWYLLDEAAENLGMSNLKASEMSQSDWDRLNAEIRRLRN